MMVSVDNRTASSKRLPFLVDGIKQLYWMRELVEINFDSRRGYTCAVERRETIKAACSIV
jgi:hypothetical protein